MWHPVKQNSDEPCPCCGKTWMQLRAGKITGSSIGKVMANYGKSFGDPAKRLAVSIATVECGGMYHESEFSNKHMDRGHQEEPIARRKYSEETFTDVDDGGFYDNGITGCSPDGRPVPEGLVEIKSVMSPYHYYCIKKDTYDPKYKWQLVFNINESGQPWGDYVSYCSTFPPGGELYVKRVFRNELENEIGMMEKRISEFRKYVDAVKKNIMLHIA